MAEPAGTRRQRLDSWKQIAQYLQRDVRTAERWAAHDGLPVHRIGGVKGRVVFAYADEIDAWLSGHRSDATVGREITVPTPRRTAQFRALVAVGLMAFGLLAAGLAVAPAWRRSSPVADAKIEGRSVFALDGAGREVWRYELPELRQTFGPSTFRVDDVDQDGRPDLFVAAILNQPSTPGEGRLLLFDSSGKLRWDRRLDDRYRYGDVEYGPEWYPQALTTIQRGDEVRLVAAFHHHLWWPDVVAVLDASGRVIGRFVHAGWIQWVGATRDGRHLLAAGVSNAFQGTAMAVVDLERIDGASPSDGGTLPRCSNCPSGSPSAYFVVPWSDLAFPAELPVVSVAVGRTGTIDLHAVQRRLPEGRVPDLIVTIAPDLTVQQRLASDSFRELHTQLERNREITHGFERCPWRNPPVRVWTPGAGWREVK